MAEREASSAMEVLYWFWEGWRRLDSVRAAEGVEEPFRPPLPVVVVSGGRRTGSERSSTRVSRQYCR